MDRLWLGVRDNHSWNFHDRRADRILRLVQTGFAPVAFQPRDGNGIHHARRRDAPRPVARPDAYSLVFVRPGLARLLISSRADKLPPALAFLPGRFRARASRAAVLVSRRGLGVRLAVGILELLGSRRLDLHVSELCTRQPAMENLPDARAGLSGFPSVCVRI